MIQLEKMRKVLIFLGLLIAAALVVTTTYACYIPPVCEIDCEPQESPSPSPTEEPTPPPHVDSWSGTDPANPPFYNGYTPECLALFWTEQGVPGDGKLTLKWYVEGDKNIDTVNIRYRQDGVENWQYGVTGIPYKSGSTEISGLDNVHYWFDIVGVESGGHGGKWYSECSGAVDPSP